MIYIRFEPSTNLGNWLFQILYARELSFQHGMRHEIAYLCSNEDDEKRLRKSAELYPDVKYVYAVSKDIRYCDLNYPGYHPVEDWDGVGDILLRGLFQHLSYFDAVRARAYLRCPQRVRNVLTAKYEDLLSRPLLVGVSVRRGDYLKYPQMHPFVGRAFLRSAIEKFPREATYVVCSDDLQWCRKFFSERNFPRRRFVIFGGEDILTQLFVHAHCHHNIISNSTFSWWGAFLNANPDKRVIFPSMWFGMVSKIQPYEWLYWPGVEIVENKYTFGLWAKARLCLARQFFGLLLRRLKIIT